MSEILLYQSDDGQAKLEVRFGEDTVWLTLGQMAELSQRDKSVISRHVKNVFDEAELDRDATVAEFATVQVEGSRTVERMAEHYNLDVIISVGYRVKSHRGTQFRRWATPEARRARHPDASGVGLPQGRRPEGGVGVRKVAGTRSEQGELGRAGLQTRGRGEQAAGEGADEEVSEWMTEVNAHLTEGERLGQVVREQLVLVGEERE